MARGYSPFPLELVGIRALLNFMEKNKEMVAQLFCFTEKISNEQAHQTQTKKKKKHLPSEK